MTPDQKLAHITRSLKDAGIEALVMGGHAVRYYGIDRNTIDFDLVTSLATPGELRLRLSKSNRCGAPRHFALVEVGRRAYKRHAMDVDRADNQAKLIEE